MIKSKTDKNILSRVISHFVFAGFGLRYLWQREITFRLEVLAAILVFILAWILNWPLTKYLWLTVICGLVLVGEILNTIVERLLDVINPKLLPAVARIKDMLSAFVLLLAFMSMVMGIILLVI